ncbi:unnamed protein product [Cyprideis torosa]|uniref:Uncharacterized protein n=1 Tax=Cyprideis torosa TaxID=163714 RepID=A0A7R8W846_9CRUS|nr:unnamed protein product [Cyprideis torosa]CAG0887061.1 unnamed protein product [Cyprideis torosa]
MDGDFAALSLFFILSISMLQAVGGTDILLGDEILDEIEAVEDAEDHLLNLDTVYDIEKNFDEPPLEHSVTLPPSKYDRPDNLSTCNVPSSIAVTCAVLLGFLQNVLER